MTAEARLARNDARLRPGMFVQVQLVSCRRASDVVMVPKEASLHGRRTDKLFVIRDGRAVEQRINPGQESDGWMEVPRDVVSPGERVAISALNQLVTGTPVRASGTTRPQTPDAKD